MSGSEVPITLYTDGACSPNPGPGGWAAVLESGPHQKVISGGVRRSTNNRMELRAVIEALKCLKHDGSTVVVVTDSQYVAKAVTLGWLEKWAAKGFRKADGIRENADLWVELRALLPRHSVTFRWIRGHAGHEKNEQCDLLAVAARRADGLGPDEGFENAAAAHGTLGLVKS